MSVSLNMNPMKFCLPFEYRKQLDIEYSKLFHQNVNKFLDATRDLTDRQFRVVAMRMFSGGEYTLKAIADVMKISPSTVKYEYARSFITIAAAFGINPNPHHLWYND